MSYQVGATYGIQTGSSEHPTYGQATYERAADIPRFHWFKDARTWKGTPASADGRVIIHESNIITGPKHATVG